MVKANNPRYFDVVLAGPEGGPFAGGSFKLEMFLPEGYPMTPPKIRFLTRVYHPNIDQLGRICLDVLKDKWSPALQMRTILMSIQALMDHPCTDDPLDTTINKHCALCAAPESDPRRPGRPRRRSKDGA